MEMETMVDGMNFGQLLKEFHETDISLFEQSYFKGLLQLDEENYQYGLDQLTRTIKNSPSVAVYILRSIARKRFKNDQLGALEDCDKAVKLNPQSKLAHFMRGKNYLTTLSYEKAIIDFQNVLELDPKNEYAIKILKTTISIDTVDSKYHGRSPIISLENVEQLEEVVLMKKRQGVLKNMSKEVKLKAAYRSQEEGDRSCNKEDYYHAWISYNYSIQTQPNIGAYLARANLCLKLKWYRWAVTDCDRVLSMHPEHVEGLLTRGIAYENMNINDKAVSDFTLAIETNQYCYTAMMQLKRLFYQDKIPSKEKTKIQYSIRSQIRKLFQSIDNPKYLYEKLQTSNLLSELNSYDIVDLNAKLLVAARDLRGNYTAASLLYDYSINLKPCSNTYFLRGFCKFKQEDHEGAIADANECLDMDRNHDEAYILRMGANYNLKMLEETIRDGRKVLELLGPDSKQGKQATQHLKAAYCQIALDRLHHNIRFENPYEKEDQADKQKFLEKLSKMSLEKKKLQAELYRQRGNVYFKEKKFHPAWFMYNKSIATAPTVEAYNNRAQVGLKMKWYRWAVDDCNKVLEMENKNIKGLSRRATAYDKLDMKEKAAADFELVLTLEPSNTVAKSYLSSIHPSYLKNEEIQSTQIEADTVKNNLDEKCVVKEKLQSEDKLQSKEKPQSEKKLQSKDKLQSEEKIQLEEKLQSEEKLQLEKKIESEENLQSEDKLQSLERLHKHLKNNVITKCIKEEALQSLPEKTTVAEETKLDQSEELLRKGDESFKSGEFIDAVGHYHQSIKLKPTSMAYYKRGTAFLKLESYKTSISDYNKALEMDPHSTRVLFGRGIIFKKIGKFQEAMKDFHEILKLDPFNSEAGEMIKDITKFTNGS